VCSSDLINKRSEEFRRRLLTGLYLAFVFPKTRPNLLDRLREFIYN